MDFVTITDHDSIDGCLSLLNRDPDLPDFFISEEVETWFPDTRAANPRQRLRHRREAARGDPRRRRNIYDLHEYIRQENIIASANHMFQNYRMRNSPRRYFEEMLRMFDVFEVKNGAMTTHHNRLVEDLMTVVREKRGAVSLVAGSDAHTLAPLAPRLHGRRGRRPSRSSSPRSGRAPASCGATRWGSACSSRTSTAWSSATTEASSTGRTRSSPAPRRPGTWRSPRSARRSRPRASRWRSPRSTT